MTYLGNDFPSQIFIYAKSITVAQKIGSFIDNDCSSHFGFQRQ